MKKILKSYRNLIFTILFGGPIFVSCQPAIQDKAEDVAVPITPVQVTYIANISLSKSTELMAVSAYLQKSYVKASINGYVQSSGVQTGEQVTAGQILFTLITKEAKAIGNTINALDPAFKFSGLSKIRADQSGFITVVNHQKGDYVQDGEALAEISNQNSLVFLLDLPYELRGAALGNQMVEVVLPDGEKLKGAISGLMPVVDSLAQTQKLIIRVNPSHAIPAGLIAKVRMTTLARPDAQTVPKSAILANETEDEFWVMKLINDSTAVKIVVQKGIEDGNNVEILKPIFTLKDRIIMVGSYGLSDTAKVKIVK